MSSLFPKLAGVSFLLLLGTACATGLPAMAPWLPEERQALDRAQELRNAGRYAEAIPFARRALALREEALGGAHPEVAERLDLLGELHRLAMDYAQAGPLLQRALAIWEAALGPQHPDVARALHTLANHHLDQDQYALAEPLYQRALAIRIVYLTSGTDLLPREGAPPASSVVVIANPDFNAPAEAAPEPARRSALLESFYASQRALSDILSFIPLAGTLHEAESVRRVYPHARLLLGRDATKASLLGLSTPGILHIATHGFFVDEAPAPADTRAVGTMVNLHPSIPVDLPDPLLRSGLVLAGARVNAARRTLEDSVVTGLEMAGMDLWGTQLVVLSACDTGRGTIMLGQGVYGLRRALVLAGAETLVTSLWKVQDDTTSELMSAYYRHLKAGQGRISALRSAMRELREQHTHPFFWAPFIGIGQDTPLRGVGADARPPQRPEAPPSPWP